MLCSTPTGSQTTNNQELVVITKTYDLILWSWHHTGKFPRNHRFILGERIERNLYDLLETLIRAKYTRNRQGLREKANLTLEILRFQMRAAQNRQKGRTAPPAAVPAGPGGPTGIRV